MALHVERRERVAVLTLDDPERRNALSLELVGEIVDAVAAIEEDDGIGALVVTGAPPAFCSGADLSGLQAMSGREGERERDPDAVHDIYDGFLAIRNCTLPTVAAVNGPAVGAGFNLALACDVRFVCPSARLDARFATIGLHPGGGHTWLLERAVGPQAACALDLFGERVEGQRAVEIGLAWRCVADDQLLDAAVEYAARAATVERELARAIKATMREIPWMRSYDEAVETELTRQRWSFEQGFLKTRPG
ncbi:MAG TPA: enoyl-CoA hydratase [Acidimicrobiia bacterium]|nr:enoyl-CoA hydratase [Acidimicrobiia bacterium]